MDSFGLNESSNNISNEKEENLKTKIEIPKEKLILENKIINSHAIQFLNISSIYITITFRLDKTYLTFSKLPTILSHLITSFSTTFTPVSVIVVSVEGRLCTTVVLAKSSAKPS